MFPSSAYAIKPETNVFEETCKEQNSRAYNDLLPITGFDLFRRLLFNRKLF